MKTSKRASSSSKTPRVAKAVSLVVYDPDGMKEGDTFPPHTKYRDGKLQNALEEDKRKRQARRIKKLDKGKLQ